MSGNPGSPVYLIDVSFFVFRAYHALPPLNTSSGQATNAVHGVATMLERLLRSERPIYVGACFDSSGDTFRHEIYPDYKANRDEPDEDLKLQFPLVRRLIRAMNITCFEHAGAEADDILATLALRCSRAGHSVVIVTGDKDLMQCVSDRVSLSDPVKGRRVGKPQVLEKFGVAPESVPDVLGLMGDSSDNIPGIKGIGPKSAAVLMAHFGSLEQMYERLDEIESLSLRGAKAVRKKIEEGRAMALLCRRLATVDYEIPVDAELEDLRLCKLSSPELEALAEELEMRKLPVRMRELASNLGLEIDSGGVDREGHGEAAIEKDGEVPGRSASPDAKMPKRSGNGAEDLGFANSGSGEATGSGIETGATRDLFTTVTDAAQLRSWGDWRAMAGARVYVVLITGGDSAPGPAVLAVGRPAGGEGEFFESALLVGEAVLTQCLSAYAEAETDLVGVDIKGLCRDFSARPGSDGLDLGVASYLIDASAGDHGREDMARRLLGEEAVALEARPDAVEAALAQLRRLESRVLELLKEREQTKLYRELEHPLLSLLAAMEARGIMLDVEALHAMSRDLEASMAELVGRVYEAAGCEFNILSPLQLREILFTRLGLPSKGIKKTKSGPSTDSDSLAALAGKHPLPDLVLEYRGMAKLKSTYVDALPRLVDEHGRIHTRLNQTVTATGRLSSKDPNLQNIPVRTEEGSRIRAAFIAPPGRRLVSADYNQIELRVLAELSRDENLIAAFEQGLDIHTATAAELLELPAAEVTPAMRREAKVVNYGIVYGMGPSRLSRELGISRAAAADYIERYFERYAGVARYYEQMLERAREQGYVSTLFGRRRYLHDINSSHGGLRQAAERVATNTTIQGSAADLIKRAMVDLEAALEASGAPGADLILQIHYELLLECDVGDVDAVSALLVEVMEGVADLVVPVAVEVGSGSNWAEAH